MCARGCLPAGLASSGLLHPRFFAKQKCSRVMDVEKTKQTHKLVQFGENVEGYNFRVLNEREIRAAAGILFLATFISAAFVEFKNNFLPIKHVVTGFLADFIIRVFINPKFSPTLILGRLIVSNQVPEYVGAQQKKFAWGIC